MLMKSLVYRQSVGHGCPFHNALWYALMISVHLLLLCTGCLACSYGLQDEVLTVHCGLHNISVTCALYHTCVAMITTTISTEEV